MRDLGRLVIIEPGSFFKILVTHFIQSCVHVKPGILRSECANRKPGPAEALSLRVWVGERSSQSWGASQERSTLGYTCKHRVKYVDELLFESLTVIPLLTIFYITWLPLGLKRD